MEKVSPCLTELGCKSGGFVVGFGTNIVSFLMSTRYNLNWIFVELPLVFLLECVVKVKSNYGVGFSLLFLALVYPPLATCDESDDGAVDNMHHFMEYVFEPRYKELKQTVMMGNLKGELKKIKSCGLTLAEAANVLMRRPPKGVAQEEKSLWVSYASDVRDQAAALYQAARKKDVVEISAAYRQTIRKCNLCHQKFAEGKYQLDP